MRDGLICLSAPRRLRPLSSRFLFSFFALKDDRHDDVYVRSISAGDVSFSGPQLKKKMEMKTNGPAQNPLLFGKEKKRGVTAVWSYSARGWHVLPQP